MKDLVGYSIEATDGSIGKVKDFLFDDDKFGVRYMVADTGGWLSDKRVLVSPRHLGEPDLGHLGKDFNVALTKKQVEESPPLSMGEPISRQFEHAYSRHYAHAPYWSGDSLWGVDRAPVLSPDPVVETAPLSEEVVTAIKESHLRSFDEVRSYNIAATDGDIGQVDDFIVDCVTWKLRYLIVDTNSWLPGGKVMIAVSWLDGFEFAGTRANVDLTMDQIKDSPKFKAGTPINIDYQRKIYDYYGKPVDWDEPPTTSF